MPDSENKQTRPRRLYLLALRQEQDALFRTLLHLGGHKMAVER